MLWRYVMLYDKHSLLDILKALEEESAKSIAILSDAEKDVGEAKKKQRFINASIHYLKERFGDLKNE